MSAIDPRDRLIVALDVPSVTDARQMVEALGGSVNFYKIGLELVLRGGLELVDELRAAKKRVFLDMKLLDIGNTEEKSVAAACDRHVDFLTIHGIDTKTVLAAVAGRGDHATKILGVTVLTNLNANDLFEQHIHTDIAQLVRARATLTIVAGADGVVASAQEASAVRAAIGDRGLIVTPGIRLPDDASDDQTRIATPSSAISDGADYLVVGRPITRAPQPAEAAERFHRAIAEAL